MGHGRACIPFGKHKGTRVRLLPDAYLSWLTTCPILKTPQWNWLRESVLAELRFRGLRGDLAGTPDPRIITLGEQFMKTYSFPVETFSGAGNGCVEEIESALKLVHDESYTPMGIHCSAEAKGKIESACLSTAATNYFIFMSSNEPVNSGGFVITQYRDKYSGIALPIVADLDGVGFVIEALAPNEQIPEEITATVPPQPLGGRKISLEGQ